MQNDNCFIEDRAVSRLRQQFGGLLQVCLGMNRHWSNNAGLMRFVGPNELSVRAMMARSCFADVRYTLWRFGGRIVSAEGKELVPDECPLRGYWPGKFIEPIRHKLTKTGVETRMSVLWRYAPFETRLVAGESPVAEWVIKEEVDSFKLPDVLTNGDGPIKYRGQITREFKIFAGAHFVRIFRWNPFTSQK